MVKEFAKFKYAVEAFIGTRLQSLRPEEHARSINPKPNHAEGML